MKKSNTATMIGIVVVVLVILGIGIWISEKSSGHLAQFFGTFGNISSTSAATSTMATTSTMEKTMGMATMKNGAPATTNTMANTSATPSGVTSVVPPHITAFEPPTDSPGNSVVIAGIGFSRTDTNVISFGVSDGRHFPNGSSDNVIAVAQSLDGATLTLTLPTNFPTGTICTQDNVCTEVPASSQNKLMPGSYPVTVSNQGGTSNTYYLTVTAQ